jgi:hypothetical protein
MKPLALRAGLCGGRSSDPWLRRMKKPVKIFQTFSLSLLGKQQF